jgi:hypothetical protein
MALFHLKFNLKRKLTLFLLVVSFFKIEARTTDESTKITLDLNNVTIERVLSKIEAKLILNFSLIEATSILINWFLLGQNNKQLKIF